MWRYWRNTKQTSRLSSCPSGNVERALHWETFLFEAGPNGWGTKWPYWSSELTKGKGSWEIPQPYVNMKTETKKGKAIMNSSVRKKMIPDESMEKEEVRRRKKHGETGRVERQEAWRNRKLGESGSMGKQEVWSRKHGETGSMKLEAKENRKCKVGSMGK